VIVLIQFQYKIYYFDFFSTKDQEQGICQNENERVKWEKKSYSRKKKKNEALVCI